MNAKSILCLVACAILILSISVVFGAELTLESAAHSAITSVKSGDVGKYIIIFDLDTIPQGAYIDDAYIKVDLGFDPKPKVSLSIVASPITESLIKSNLPTAYVPAFNDTLSFLGLLYPEVGEDMIFHVRELVQMWVSGKLQNNGIILMALEQSDSKMELNLKGAGVAAELHVMYADGPDRR